MTKLLLHIGSFRTGSTSTQFAFWSSRHRLRRMGILYPETGQVTKAHHELGLSLLGQEIEGCYQCPAFRPLLKSLAQEIAISGCGTVLVSTEVLMLLVDDKFGTEGKKERLEEFLSMFSEVRVICVLRHQAPLIESTFRFEVLGHDNLGQTVTESFPDYVRRWLEKPLLFYTTIEQAIRSVRPDLIFDFISFASASQSGSLVRFVYECAGLVEAYCGEKRINESQGRLGTLAILLRNRGEIIAKLGRPQFLRWSSLIDSNRGESLYDSALLQEVTAKFEASNEELANRVGFNLNHELAAYEQKLRLSGSSLSSDELQGLKQALDHKIRHPLTSQVKEWLGFRF